MTAKRKNCFPLWTVILVTVFSLALTSAALAANGNKIIDDYEILNNGIRYYVNHSDNPLVGDDGLLVTVEHCEIPSGTHTLVIPDLIDNKQVNRIKAGAFSDCRYSLNEIFLPVYLEKLPARAFSGCDHLTTIHISGSVEEIDPRVFNDCPALTDVYFNGSKSEWKSLYEGTDEFIVHCSDGTMEQYTQVWVKFDVKGHGTAPKTQMLRYGQTAAKPADPTADGYAFGGWYDKNNYNLLSGLLVGSPQAFDFSTPITDTITLYAYWSKDDAGAEPGSGSVLSSELQVTPKDVDFGTLKPGAGTVRKTVTVKNVSDRDLFLSYDELMYLRNDVGPRKIGMGAYKNLASVLHPGETTELKPNITVEDSYDPAREGADIYNEFALIVSPNSGSSDRTIIKITAKAHIAAADAPGIQVSNSKLTANKDMYYSSTTPYVKESATNSDYFYSDWATVKNTGDSRLTLRYSQGKTEALADLNTLGWEFENGVYAGTDGYAYGNIILEPGAYTRVRARLRMEYYSPNWTSTNDRTGKYFLTLYGQDSQGRKGSEAVVELTVSVDFHDLSTEKIDNPSAWAEKEVKEAIELKLVPSALQSKYTQPTTRAEFCALAASLYETALGKTISERATFTDTTDLNVQKMAGLGVVNGVGNNRFDPYAQLTREQAATMLARLAAVMGKPMASAATNFADNAQISDWARDAVGQVQAAGIMNGVGDNKFSPKTSYTREQSILTILRTFHYVK